MKMKVSCQDEWYQHVAKLNGSEPYMMTEHPLTASYIYPGPDMSAIDRDNLYNVVHLARYIEHSSHYPNHVRREIDGLSFLSYHEISKERLLFIGSSKLTMSRLLNHKNVNMWPLNVEKKIQHVGKSTVTVETVYSSPGIGEPLLKYAMSLVHVDLKTRQAIPLPDWYLERYKDQGANQGLLKMVPPEKPETTFCQRMQVWWSDTDINNHANHVSYVRWFLNTLHCYFSRREESSGDYNLETSAIKSFTEETLKNGVKELTIAFLGECKENDVVDVHIWQLEGHEFVVNCSVEKEGVTVCTMTIEYHGPMAVL